MGYDVETSGRVLLPRDREDAAFASVSAAMSGLDGWFDPDDEQWPVSSLTDLAEYAAASVTRDGDWLVLATNEDGDPKWSDQATAFYADLARWVDEGEVHVSGEDGTEWRYTYAAGGLTQSGTNGWDGSTEPFGAPAEEQEEAQPARPARRGRFRRR